MNGRAQELGLGLLYVPPPPSYYDTSDTHNVAQELGLGLLYVGCESGDDEVLRRCGSA